MKQFKTEEEQFRKFITRTERLIKTLQTCGEKIEGSYLEEECILTLSNINEYKKELGMYQHPDAVKSTKYIEQEINFPKND